MPRERDSSKYPGKSAGYGSRVPEPAAVPAESNEKRMKLRYAGKCRLCGANLAAQAFAVYERETKTVRCVNCRIDEAAVDSAGEVSRTVAGASARREYERRKAADEARLRGKWGRLGGIAVALSDERQSTAAWNRGAIGEEVLGRRLDALVGENLAVLHDRRIPGSTANIDHLVITPAGVWVVDAKRYKGRRPELRIEGGIFRARAEKLVVGGRDSTKLVDGVLKQVDVVRGLLDENVPVNGAICFVESDWPLIGGAFTTRGIHVVWPKRIEKLIVAGGPVRVDVARVRDELTRGLR
jgi:hypothetical protein